jgi:hypothetical protein
LPLETLCVSLRCIQHQQAGMAGPQTLVGEHASLAASLHVCTYTHI